MGGSVGVPVLGRRFFMNKLKKEKRIPKYSV